MTDLVVNSDSTNNNDVTEKNGEVDIPEAAFTDDVMVIEPKFADYGTIHSIAEVPQHNSLHALLGPKTVLTSTPVEAETSSSSKDMVQGDLYQRQPLLVNSSKGDHWGSSKVNTDNDYCIEDDDVQKSGTNNGVIRIEMPSPIREEPRFPQERWKTFIAAIAMMLGFLATLISLSIVHNQVPLNDPPLPDVILDNVPEIDPALNVSEYIIVFNVISCIVCMIFHKHRFIIMRRIFLLMSLLYMYRAVTMFVTVLPLANRTYPCAPETNQTSVVEVLKRVIKMSAGFGLSINGDQIYCGDFIYSGHTVILVLSYLVISEYTPRKLWPVGIVYWVLSLLGIIFLEMSHAHYTIDVVIAYFITTRLFWLYHTLANHTYLRQATSHNLLGREWWFWLFQYFESNIEGPVPIQYEWPLPWPRRFHSKNRDS